jgi:hypothetical protein
LLATINLLYVTRATHVECSATAVGRKGFERIQVFR